MISCSCGYPDGGIQAVGHARIVTCRTPRKCSDCGSKIAAGDEMAVQSFYDYDDYQPVAPSFFCAECNDLMGALEEAGFCFSFGDVRNQWMLFLWDNDPENPACKKYFERKDNGEKETYST